MLSSLLNERAVMTTDNEEQRRFEEWIKRLRQRRQVVEYTSGPYGKRSYQRTALDRILEESDPEANEPLETDPDPEDVK
jgi:hypothetical protein